jgi:cell division protein FtsB
MVHLTKENKQLKEDNAKMSQNVNDCNETIKQLEKEISDTISEKD